MELCIILSTLFHPCHKSKMSHNTPCALQIIPYITISVGLYCGAPARESGVGLPGEINCRNDRSNWGHSPHCLFLHIWALMSGPYGLRRNKLWHTYHSTCGIYGHEKSFCWIECLLCLMVDWYRFFAEIPKAIRFITQFWMELRYFSNQNFGVWCRIEKKGRNSR